MFNFDDLVKAMQKAGVDAMQASNPANMVFGKVISANPLKIQIEQKLILGKAQLVLTRNVTDYDITMTVDHTTEDGGSESHNHAYTGTKTFKIHNALKAGEKVILMQVLGGQTYIVIDRIGKG